MDVFKETDDGDYDTGCKIFCMLDALELNGEELIKNRTIGWI